MPFATIQSASRRMEFDCSVGSVMRVRKHGPRMKSHQA